jgi:hypothetical protein
MKLDKLKTWKTINSPFVIVAKSNQVIILINKDVHIHKIGLNAFTP